VRDNLARQNYPVAVFEQGRVYLKWPEGAEAPEGAASRSAPADEREALGIVLCGPLGGEHWLGDRATTTFYTLKGIVERLLRSVDVREAVFEPSSEPFLHPGKSADLIVAGRRAGSLGLVRPDVLAALEVEADEVYAAELDVEALSDGAARRVPFEDTVAYPAASQDLAIVVDADVPAADVVALIEKAGGKLLRGARVFDVYEGDQVPAGKRSLAVRLTMRAADRTLSEKDVNGVRRKVVSALERELDAALR
jgi:phenylalanyl-tRNA synthetase beta chain